MAIHLIQLLCPLRHCVLAQAYDTEESTAGDSVAMLQDVVAAMVSAKLLNPWCGLCGSRDLKFEDAPRKFKTMDEAVPALMEAQQMQLKVVAALRERQARNN